MALARASRSIERHWQPRRRTREGAGPLAGTLHLAQAQSNRGARGRKKDFPDAERLVKRLVAHDLTLSFVPEAEQRPWRTVTRRKHQLTGNRVQLQNRLQCLLEEAHIKLPSLVTGLLGLSARRMLQARGQDDPGIAQPRLPRRVTSISIGHSSMSDRDFRPWFEELKGKLPAGK